MPVEVGALIGLDLVARPALEIVPGLVELADVLQAEVLVLPQIVARQWRLELADLVAAGPAALLDVRVDRRDRVDVNLWFGLAHGRSMVTRVRPDKAHGPV